MRLAKRKSIDVRLRKIYGGPDWLWRTIPHERSASGIITWKSLIFWGGMKSRFGASRQLDMVIADRILNEQLTLDLGKLAWRLQSW